MNNELLWQLVSDAPFNAGMVSAIEAQVTKKIIRSNLLRAARNKITSTGVWAPAAEMYEHTLPGDVLKVLTVSAPYTQTLRSVLSCAEEVEISYSSDSLCRISAGLESAIFWRTAAILSTKLTANKKTTQALTRFADVLETLAIRMDARQQRVSALTGSMTLQSRRNPWYTGTRKTFGTNTKRYK